MNNANLQNAFLNIIRKNDISITVFLVNGYQIRGTVKSFDNFTILLECEGKQQMIYKHAVSTIVPAKPVEINPEKDV